ncbi:ATP-dependent DNA ligase [Kitasatospora nipponensis]|uniref:DNA ligase (ATP) n=1 Tax=Kitasatospora nipponensis TaxID=258049 RepID=A0ABN1VRM1_9ACTN
MAPRHAPSQSADQALVAVEPMLATPGPLPRGAGWAFEVKWDGARAIARSHPDTGVVLTGRSGADLTAAFPEVVEALREQLPEGPLVLDGELVCFDPEGRPSFALLQRRLHLTRTAAIRSAARTLPATYLPFDLLLHGDGSLLQRPYRERRAALRALGLGGGRVRVPPHWENGGGDAALAFTREHHLEGIVAKRLESRYAPGIRSTDWVKTKSLRTVDIVIGGWIAGGPAGTAVKAVLSGLPTPEGLRYVGRVGTGFSTAERRALAALLRRLQSPTSPFSTPVTDIPRGDVLAFTRPVLTAEVEHLEWTSAGRLRQPVWRGLRGPYQDRPL